MLFRNRSDAGRRLAKALLKYKSRHPVILALPRGGVLVAAESRPPLMLPSTCCSSAGSGCQASRNLRWAPSPTASSRPSFAMTTLSNYLALALRNSRLSAGGNALRLNDDESTIWEIGPDPK